MYNFKRPQSLFCKAILLLFLFASHQHHSKQNNDVCNAINTLVLNSVGTAHIMVSWELTGNLPANGYEWQVRTEGIVGTDDVGLVQSGTSATNSLTITNLPSDTDYLLYVRAHCSESLFSEWTNISFATTSLMLDLDGQIGTGTGWALSLYGPIMYVGSTPRNGSVANMIFTASELDEMGIPQGALITGIAFNKLSNATGEGYTPVRMRVLVDNSTTTVPMSTTTTLQDIEASHTEVMDNSSYVLPGAIGWVDFNFDQPYEYTGDNLEIATVMYHSPGPNGSDAYFSTFVAWQYTAGYNDHMNGAWPLPNTDMSNTASVILNNHSGTSYKERPNIKIYYQVSAAVEEVVVTTQDDVTAEITTNQGSLQLVSAVKPSTASQNVKWSLVSGAEFASINHDGQVTAFANGTIVARATSLDDATFFDDITITVSNQKPCNVAFPGQVEPITSVQFAGISNTSPSTMGVGLAHEDFTSVFGQVTQGQSYPISVKGNTGGNFVHHITAYIDWNRNNSFLDAGETFSLGTLQNSNGNDVTAATGNITIPNDATPGTTTMRIIKKFNSVGQPCNSLGYGQAEDYTLNVNQNTMGTDDLIKNKIALHPNPVTDVVSLQAEEIVLSIEIYNTLGQSVMQSVSKDINMSALSAGVYMFRIYFENGKTAVAKVIKK